MQFCYLLSASLLALPAGAQTAAPLQVASPDGAVRVTIALAAGDRPTYGRALPRR